MAKKFPDLTGDGKVTKADILKGRGVAEMKRAALHQNGYKRPSKSLVHYANHLV